MDLQRILDHKNMMSLCTAYCSSLLSRGVGDRVQSTVTIYPFGRENVVGKPLLERRCR